MSGLRLEYGMNIIKAPDRYFFQVNGNECSMTGKYQRVMYNRSETQFIEVAYTKHTRVRLLETFMDRFIERYSFVSEDIIEYVNIHFITCRAVYDEIWSAP